MRSHWRLDEHMRGNFGARRRLVIVNGVKDAFGMADD
jgi:hypothetical protein